ncbi:SMI1/KNR4 family protein [Actinomadura sp. 6N118]|uniref:SMI1/KNR4 family protein n=1 Tax=Actinomadura sp. 6N118 TaxID=3375151 RepID=UPI003793607E
MDVDQAGPAELDALRAAFDVDLREPPLGWDAVRAFETEHAIVLPEPYRTFVAEICDGAAQGPPDYGLLPLAAVPGDWRDLDQRVLARPFPLTQPWLWEDDPRPAEKIQAAIEQVYDHGTIVLGTDGCAMYWHLVVTGPHRGHVWNICGEGAQPFGAEFGFTTGHSGFAGWVGHWATGKWWWDAE